LAEFFVTGMFAPQAQRIHLVLFILATASTQTACTAYSSNSGYLPIRPAKVG